MLRIAGTKRWVAHFSATKPFLLQRTSSTLREWTQGETPSSESVELPQKYQLMIEGVKTQGKWKDLAKMEEDEQQKQKKKLAKAKPEKKTKKKSLPKEPEQKVDEALVSSVQQSLQQIKQLENDPVMEFTRINAPRETVFAPFRELEKTAYRRFNQPVVSEPAQGLMGLVHLDVDTKQSGDGFGDKEQKDRVELEELAEHHKEEGELKEQKDNEEREVHKVQEAVKGEETEDARAIPQAEGYDGGNANENENENEREEEEEEEEDEILASRNRKSKRENSLARTLKKAEYTFRNLAARGNLDGALAHWEDMKKTFGSNLTIDVLNAVIHVLFEAKRVEECEKTIRYMKSLGLQPNVATYSIMIRLENDIAKCEQLVEEAKEKGELGLRLFSYLLIKYAKARDVEKAFKLFHEIERLQLKPDDIIYHALLRSARDSPEKNARVEEVFRALRTHHFFISEEVEKEITEILSPDEWEVKMTNVHESGECLCCSSQLESLVLSPELQTSLREELQRVISRTKDAVSFGKFQGWLKRHGPFDVIVDGLNVGFANQGQFIPSNINKMVDHFQEQGLRVGVLVKNHALTFDSIRELQRKYQLFSVSQHKLDDLYWIYAAVYGGSQKGMDILCVTNDKLRDHNRYLDPSKTELFLRWKLGHRIEFAFVGHNKSHLQIFPRMAYYTIAQKREQRWHIPLANNQWLCILRK